MINHLRKIWFSFGLALMVAPQLALAQVCRDGTPTASGTCLPESGSAPWSGIDTFSGAVGLILNIAMIVVGLIAVLFVVVGGYRYITAGGDEEQVKNARTTIINALIGIVIVLLALALVRIVSNAVSGDI